jgi:GNAT superfamily N-acetyltransferase
MVAGKFETRQAVPEDANAIALAHLDSIRSIGPRFFSRHRQDLGHRDYARHLRERHARRRGVFHRDRPARRSTRGSAFSSHRVDDAQDGTSVYVRGSSARRGIGTALLQLAEAHALAHGATVVQIQASLAGVDFYKVNGYEELGRGDAYLMSGHSMPCVLMRKELT